MVMLLIRGFISLQYDSSMHTGPRQNLKEASTNPHQRLQLRQFNHRWRVNAMDTARSRQVSFHVNSEVFTCSLLSSAITLQITIHSSPYSSLHIL